MLRRRSMTGGNARSRIEWSRQFHVLAVWPPLGFAPPMAEIQPFPALHYNLGAVPSLADVTAPPYDVIDPPLRAALLARSPLNVVEIDLPEAPSGGDPYEHAAETLEA